MTPGQGEKPFGFVEWFRPGDHARAEAAIDAMAAAGARRLRIRLSAAEHRAEGGEAWRDWLLPRLGQAFELLPCVPVASPWRAGPGDGAPPGPQNCSDFLDAVLTRYGQHFAAVELSPEPGALFDPEGRAGSDRSGETIGAAVGQVGARGWRVVLGGPSAADPRWLELMGAQGVLAAVAAVGLPVPPDAFDVAGGQDEWRAQVSRMRAVLGRHNPAAEIWITEGGYSTWRHDGIGQVSAFLQALDAPADRLYWSSWSDLPDAAGMEGRRFDPPRRHLGAVDAAGRPKLLGRLLAEGGVAAARGVARLASPSLRNGAAAPVVITGGAGFIGSNLADALLADGGEVVIADSLARPGVEQNLAWLQDRHGARAHAALIDIRDPDALDAVVSDAAAVFHLAAQTAVTTSLDAPVADFETNARGTLNLLEAVRRAGRRTPVVFASTNKVYGGLDDIGLVEMDERYIPEDEALRANGVGEARPLEFSTPYGCSKGVADQYVLDYAKSFGLPAAVLRMSCIYGPRQFGTEDQGWVAHFLLSTLRGAPISVFGDGKQVRDVLHVSDAVAAYRGVLGAIDRVSGTAFNLGGGPHNAVSLRIVLGEIARVVGRDPDVRFDAWRPADQLWFVADTRRLEAAIGWTPRITWRDGLRDLADFLAAREAGAARPAGRRALG